MSDIIQLLPDSIANQIAAGEVIQRPASVLKELMENSIDAGATQIKVVLKDAGKTLIQVIDDGVGMSDTDARMCFERHATSKIRTAQDLFSIKTMGFRGEAMASIAAIAHVELLTRHRDFELGVRMIMKASKLEKQEPISVNPGTQISVKNLFFNIPARRKFLKSDPVELKHLMEEFHRVVLGHPNVYFTLHHNDNEVYHLPASNLRQRIVNVFGKNTNEKIVPVEEDMDLIKIQGFIGKPEAAKKTKGDQYIFVNNRFIRSHYLNHAIRTAYEEMITKEYHPLYVLNIDIDPNQIDINVHPTKTEIKFSDERLIYNYVRVAARHALGKYTLSPTLDFDSPKVIERMQSASKGSSGFSSSSRQQAKGNVENWDEIYSILKTEKSEEPVAVEGTFFSLEEEDVQSKMVRKKPFQIHNKYVVHQIKSGFLLIDYKAANERILYESYLKAMTYKEPLTQKQLFPKTIELGASQKTILTEIMESINCLGFEIEDFGNNSIIIHGIPAGIEPSTDLKVLIEELLEQYNAHQELQIGIEESVARSMSKSASNRTKKGLSDEEMTNIIDELFACDIPHVSPSGRKCYIQFDLDELAKQFSG